MLADIVEGAPLPQPGGEPREDWAAPPRDPSTERPATETDRDTVTQLAPNRTVNNASGRAEAARMRVVELRRRREGPGADRAPQRKRWRPRVAGPQESFRRAKQAVKLREPGSRATGATDLYALTSGRLNNLHEQQRPTNVSVGGTKWRVHVTRTRAGAHRAG